MAALVGLSGAEHSQDHVAASAGHTGIAGPPGPKSCSSVLLKMVRGQRQIRCSGTGRDAWGRSHRCGARSLPDRTEHVGLAVHPERSERFQRADEIGDELA